MPLEPAKKCVQLIDVIGARQKCLITFVMEERHKLSSSSVIGVAGTTKEMCSINDVIGVRQTNYCVQ